MKNKFLISTLLLLVSATVLCSYSLAANDSMGSAGNALMDAGNSIGNAAVHTKDAILDGTQSLANGAANLGNDAMNGMENMTDDSTATFDDNNNNIDDNDDYTAQRTAAPNSGLFGMSDTMTTWVILGIVGAIIVGLVWYYGKQFEHKNYSND